MRLSLPLLALAALAAPLSAAPQDGGEPVTVRIDLADLDVTTAADRARVAERIEARAREACTIDINTRFAYGRELVDEACVVEARERAMAALDRIVAAKTRKGRTVAAN